MSVHPTHRPKKRDEAVEEFHIKWFAGVIKGLDPGLTEGFKGAIEEAADELGIHAEPGETAQQLLFRVVTAAKPQSAHSRNRLVESGKIDAELLNLILPACVTVRCVRSLSGQKQPK
jgi:hypothetical protein